MKIAACYIRVSTDDQTEYSPDAQLKKIREYAKAHDMIIPHEYIYTENGISGRSVEKRTAFKTMIATAKKKPRPFDVVLIHTYDRFARNVKESRIYKELLRDDLGIDLISVTEDFGTGKNSFLMEGIKDILNEYYSMNLSDEVKKGMTEKASRGEVQSIAPYGYRVQNGQYEVVPEEAETVRYIFRQWNNGAAYFSIAKAVNEMGMRTHKGKLFETRTVQYILTNPVYIGKIRWTPGVHNRHDYDNSGSIIAQGKHEAIIAEQEYESAQTRIRFVQATRKPKTRPSETVKDWPSGIVHCAACGKPLVATAHDRYTCNGYLKGTCGNTQGVGRELLKKAIIHALYQAATGQDTIDCDLIPTTKKARESMIPAEKRIKNITNQLERAKEAYLAGVDSITEYKEIKTRLETELAQAKQQAEKEQAKQKSLRPTQSDIRKKILAVAKTLENPKADTATKASSLRSITTDILYDKQGHNMKIVYVIAY